MDPKGVLNHMTQTNVTDLGSALSSPRRVAMLLAVSKSPHTVGALAKVLGVAQSTASYHVAQLLQAGLVCIRDEGTEHIINATCGEVRIRLAPGEPKRRTTRPNEANSAVLTP